MTDTQQHHVQDFTVPSYEYWLPALGNCTNSYNIKIIPIEEFEAIQRAATHPTKSAAPIAPDKKESL